MEYFAVSSEILELIVDVFRAGEIMQRVLDDEHNSSYVTLIDDWYAAKLALEAYLKAL